VEHSASSRWRLWAARVLVAAVTIPAMAIVQPAATNAAPGDCGFVGAVATFTAISGSWSTASNWDTNAVPLAGPVCILDGHTVQVGSGVGIPTPLRNLGTIQIAGTGVSTGSGLFENSGALAVGAGADLLINLTASSTLAFSNRKGGSISIDGTVNLAGRFDNAGGSITTAGAGRLNVSGASAEFIQGNDGDNPPTQSIVNGTGFRVTAGKLSVTGSGAGTFTLLPAGLITLTGNVRAGQTVNMQCDSSGNTFVQLSGNLRNQGTIAALPRGGGTTCQTRLNVPSGTTLTNAGTMTWGTSASPTEGYLLDGQGSVVNEASGSITVSAGLTDILVAIVNDGTVTIGPSGLLVLADASFESRSGLLDNQGTVILDRSSPSFAFNALFRQRLGVVQGNPIRLNAGNVELLNSGPIAFVVSPSGVGNMRNPGGPLVIGADQSFMVHGSLTFEGSDVENRGLITVDGSGSSALVGSFGMRMDNRGRLVIATGTGTAGGFSSIQAAITNEPGGVIEAQPSINTCALGQITNRGLVDLATSCLGQGVLTLAPTSVIRIRSSATTLTGLADLRSGSVLGGTLDIITDPLNPPAAGAPRDFMVPRFLHIVGGKFAKITRATVSPNLAYLLVYSVGLGGTVRLQVGAAVGLDVSAMTAPASATVGDDVTVNWTTHLGGATSANWTESVLLSSTPVPDASATVLARVSHSGAIAAGTDIANSVQVRIPVSTPGQRFLVVVADSGSALPVPDRDAAIAATPIDVGVTPVTVGAGPTPIAVGAIGNRVVTNTTATLEGTRLLRIDGAQGTDIRVQFNPASSVVATAAVGRVPTDTDADATAVNGTLTIPRGDGVSARYVVVRNASSTATTVNVTATSPGLSIASTTPSSVMAGSPAPTAVTVTGTGFTSTSTVQLVCGATTINPALTQVAGSTLITSLFNLPTAVGVCSVVVGAVSQPNALNVIAPAVALDAASLKVDVQIVGPSTVRSEDDNRFTVRWTNRTAYSLPAPLISISTTQGRVRHVGNGGLGTPSVEILAISSAGPAGVLAPGASGSTDLLLRTDGQAPHAQITVNYAAADAAAPYNFGEALVAGLGDGVPAAAKLWVQTNGPTMVGMSAVTTVGGLQTHLDTVATLLSGLGRRIADPARLISYDLLSITGSGRLDGFQSGEYGPGQLGLALPRLTTDVATGDVIVGDGESRVRFGRLPNGKFKSPNGIGDVMAVEPGGGWSLTGRDGMRRIYSAAGLLVSVIDADLDTTTFTYSGTRLTSISVPRSGTTTYGYDAGGRITSLTDPVGRVVTFGYDAQGRRTSSIGAGVTRTTAWDANNLPTGTTTPEGITTSVTRDGFGRITQVRTNGALSATLTYNADRSVTTTDAIGQTMTSWADDTGAVAKMVDTAGRITTARRDVDGIAIGTFADGAPIGDSITKDAAKRINGVVDGAGGVTRPAFDLDGLMQAVTDQDGRTTSITRDDALRPIGITDPAGATTAIGYDTFGRLTAVADRAGRSATYSYDGNDLLSQTYVPGYGSVAFGYDAHRNLVSATGPSGATTFTYDSNDHVTGVTYPNGLGLTIAYDSAGRRSTTTTSDGQVTGVTYNARGQVATATAGGVTIARYEYDAVDRQTALAFVNGSRTEITYNNLGRVTRQRTTCCTPNGGSAGPTVVSDVQLTYDARDRVATRTDAAGVTTYTYDGADRLTNAVTVGAAPRSISYAYDGNGNRLTVNDSTSGTTTSTIDSAGRPTQIGTEAVTYAADGRMLTKGTSAYTWNQRGTLTSTNVGGTATSYVYDALGTPISSTTNGVTTKLLFDPTGIGTLVGEYSSSNTRQASYAWASGPAIRLNASGTAASFYATDPRGDVLALTGSAGSVTDTYRYLPFGEVASRTGTTVQPFAFQGQWGLRTEASGLVNARARIYDPSTGRFLSEDPEIFAAGNPATWTSSDPINNIDITGGEQGPFQKYVDHPFDPLMWLGFDESGSELSWNANGAGLLGAAAEKWVDGKMRQQLADNAGKMLAMAQQERDAYLAAMRNYGGKAKDLINQRVARLGQDALEVEKWGAKEFQSKAGTAFKFLGGALNLVQAIDNVVHDPNGIGLANVARQGGKAVLKTLLPFVGGLLVDPVDALIDEYSAWGMNTWQARVYGVDPSQMYKDMTGWKPKIKKVDGKWIVENLLSGDPNSIDGPAGAVVGANRFVARDDDLPYTIHFENTPAATLPAAEVVVTHTLDADDDLDTFSLGPVGIGAKRWNPPAGLRTWTTLLDDRDVSGLYIRLKARLDRATRTVTWTYTSIDPATMDRPADATRGFLPRNVTAPQGEGFSSYTVHALSTVPTGTVITAQASIVFDGNPAIATNVDTVIVDAGAPTAAPSVAASSSNPVVVSLGGVDDTGGSGVAQVDVWASKDGAPFALVGDAVTGQTFAFTGVVGSSYKFFAAPTDRVGNPGSFSSQSSAVVVTQTTTPTPPTPTPPTPPTPPGSDTSFVSVVPGRLLETRTDATPTIDGESSGIGIRDAGTTTELQITGRYNIPTNATAAVLNVTVTGTTGPGYITVWPCGTPQPTASNLNYTAGDTIPNLVISKIGDNGKICLFTTTNTHLIADINAYYTL
jgi:RHS repeat-associated protein